MLGVRVEDKGDGGSTWKRENPAVLARERREAARTAAAARATKLEKQLQARQAVGANAHPSSFACPAIVSACMPSACEVVILFAGHQGSLVARHEEISSHILYPCSTGVCVT